MAFGPGTRRGLLLGALLLAGCATSQPEPIADFVVFFSAQSSTPDPSSIPILDRAAAAARAAPQSAVAVEGYADPTGSPQANQILSRLRAQNVAEALVQRGIERRRIRVRPKGAVGGDPGTESRRVEIVIGR